MFCYIVIKTNTNRRGKVHLFLDGTYLERNSFPD